MSIQSICRYTYILALSAVCMLCSLAGYAQGAQAEDSVDTDKKTPKVQAAGRQLVIGADIYRPILNRYISNSFGYEFTADYFLKNEFYAVAEGGWGGSTVDYPDLKYSTTNTFVRAGFNKSALLRDHPQDWDVMFFGLRAGMANISRTSASYSFTDSLWGTATGVHPGKAFNAYWAELAAGMRVELYRGLCAGWTIRGKFLMNGRSFKDLAPLHIAGYGRGDKNSVFDFNFYISYAIRFHSQKFPGGNEVPKPGKPN